MRRIAVVLMLLVTIVPDAHADDRPISGAKLVIKRSASGREKIAFVSKDPAALFPTLGSADDPSAGGAIVEVFTQHDGTATLVMPAGAEWLPKAAVPPSYKYVNKLAPTGPSGVRSATIKQGKVLKLVTKSAPLPLTTPLGTVGIRVTTGSLRNCARFDATTIRKDVPGNFVARNALASNLPDCTDGQLASTPCADGPGGVCGGLCPPGEICVQALDGCHCNSPAQLCGNTAPQCNGECPAGEECGSTGAGTCGCITAGSSPCGHADMPLCGDGACPAGQVCRASAVLMGFPQQGCRCSSPGACGIDGLDCPAGFVCAIIDVFTGPQCIPTFCDGGTFPSCGGACPSGLTCLPLGFSSGGADYCICADGGAPCGSACGGFVCPGGQVCTVDTTSFAECGCAP